jgi:hypothetical protein
LCNRTVTAKIEAKLYAARMKTSSPVERPINPEVMPLDADTELLDIAIEWAPPILDFAPCFLFPHE